MRLAVLGLLLVLGCDASGLSNQEERATPPPPVAPAAGSIVEQLWQFKNVCPQALEIALWEMDGPVRPTRGSSEAGQIEYFAIRCTIGTTVCASAWVAYGIPVVGGGKAMDPDPQFCQPCSGGWLAARTLPCP